MDHCAKSPNPKRRACFPVPRATSQRMLMLLGKMRHHDSASLLGNLEMTQKGREESPLPPLSGKLQGAS